MQYILKVDNFRKLILIHKTTNFIFLGKFLK